MRVERGEVRGESWTDRASSGDWLAGDEDLVILGYVREDVRTVTMPGREEGRGAGGLPGGEGVVMVSCFELCWVV